MKKFDQPMMAVIEDSMLEPVYASSGSVPVIPSIPVTPEGPGGDWKVNTEWCNHNTGSHSELKINAHNYGTKSGSAIEMDFVCVGFRLDSITPGQGLAVTYQKISDTEFKLTWKNAINPNQDIGFVMQLKGWSPISPNEPAAVGVTGSPCYATVYCKSYRVY